MAIKMKKIVSSLIGAIGPAKADNSATEEQHVHHQEHSQEHSQERSQELSQEPTSDLKKDRPSVTASQAKSSAARLQAQIRSQKITYPPDGSSQAQNRPKRLASARKITPVESNDQCRRYLILNGKGGCGKTTISTNLASYLAVQGFQTAIMDYDPQESSLTWLKLRQNLNDDAPSIHGIAAHAGAGGLVTRSWQLRTPPGTERVVVDAPAGTSGAELIEILKNVNAIIIPVLPSSIDMHATARFIQDLLLIGKVRARNIPVCIVANRVPKQTTTYKKLLLFLSALNIPFVVTFKDNYHYLNAAENGLGIHELKKSSDYEVEQWQKLFAWLENAGKGSKFTSRST